MIQNIMLQFNLFTVKNDKCLCRSRLELTFFVSEAEVCSGISSFRSRCRSRPKNWRLRNTAIQLLTLQEILHYESTPKSKSKSSFSDPYRRRYTFKSEFGARVSQCPKKMKNLYKEFKIYLNAKANLEKSKNNNKMSSLYFCSSCSVFTSVTGFQSDFFSSF